MHERQRIAQIRDRFPQESAELIKGIGDDCAVFGSSPDLCWMTSTDVLVEDVHFVLKWHDAHRLGRKSIAVNLSDIAAMGGKPQFSLVSLVLPARISDPWLDRFHAGAADMLEKHNCLLIGGDISTGAALTINVMLIGSAHPEKVVYRSGGAVGQDVYVTGHLGASAAGLHLLKRGDTKPVYDNLIGAHLDPAPQIEIGRALAERRLAMAMQDISDGLATDLSHICCESRIQGVIELDSLPHTENFLDFCREYDTTFEDLALFGGEDYQLVFTAKRSDREAITALAEEFNVVVTRVGHTQKGKGGVLLQQNGRRRDISYRGFEHI